MGVEERRVGPVAGVAEEQRSADHRQQQRGDGDEGPASGSPVPPPEHLDRLDLRLG
jgi:hypothetical protein